MWGKLVAGFVAAIVLLSGGYAALATTGVLTTQSSHPKAGVSTTRVVREKVFKVQVPAAWQQYPTKSSQKILIDRWHNTAAGGAWFAIFAWNAVLLPSDLWVNQLRGRLARNHGYHLIDVQNIQINSQPVINWVYQVNNVEHSYYVWSACGLSLAASASGPPGSFSSQQGALDGLARSVTPVCGSQTAFSKAPSENGLSELATSPTPTDSNAWHAFGLAPDTGGGSGIGSNGSSSSGSDNTSTDSGSTSTSDTNSYPDTSTTDSTPSTDSTGSSPNSNNGGPASDNDTPPSDWTNPPSDFCDHHDCLGGFSTSTGAAVQCNDGKWTRSDSGPDSACADHQGVKQRPPS